MPKIVHTYVDRESCLAHGVCEHEAPEVFELSEHDHRARVRPNVPLPLDSQSDAIRRAAQGCPVSAIIAVYDDGTILGDPSVPDPIPGVPLKPARPWGPWALLVAAGFALGWFVAVQWAAA